jgi:hypothetical protein
MTSHTMTMKPLHLLRGLYRQLKTPAMHVSVSKELLQNKNVTKTSIAETAVTVTTTSHNKSRSNASTRYLIQQYRMAASVSSPTDSTTTTIPMSHSTSTTTTQQQQRHRLAMELYLLRQDIHQRGELYMMDTGADQQLSPHELSRRAAARAGLQLPEQYKE